MRAALVKRLIDGNPVDVPDALVEHRFASMLRELGIPADGAAGSPELQAEIDRIRGELRQRARDSVHAALLLERIAAQERLETGDAEIDERIAQILRAAPRERDRLADLYRSAEARREVARAYRRAESARVARRAGPDHGARRAFLIARRRKKS